MQSAASQRARDLAADLRARLAGWPDEINAASRAPPSMQWTDPLFGNRYRLTFRLLPVHVLRFEGPYWVDDGRASGVVIEVKAWHGDRFFVRPSRLLYTRNDIEKPATNAPTTPARPCSDRPRRGA